MPSFPIFKSFQQQQQTTTNSSMDPQQSTYTRRISISSVVPPEGNIAGQTSSVFSDHVVHHAEAVSSSSIAHENKNGRFTSSSAFASQLPQQSSQLQSQSQWQVGQDQQGLQGQQSSWFDSGRSGQQQHYNSQDMFMS
ncbi:hypothetical protein BGZ96_003632 [Linnemannia gamsii]|uniref:Uncharacterized protein n=1 Tax=Linnemannia gamsii TaxID=64522 RepID=A0ABQ7KGV9_9FUNG|nr:hypothetical protein BGZ96_003632 [Linnemannia gamsii]